MEAETTAFHHRRTGASHSGAVDSARVTQPDVLASAQYENVRQTKILEPEKSLMLAILEDAVRCFQENHNARCGNRKRLFGEAQRWIFQPSSDWVFSFENVCAVLGFDPQYVRCGLRRWKERDLAKQCVTSPWKPVALRSGTHG
jgi:hypothetical protein